MLPTGLTASADGGRAALYQKCVIISPSGLRPFVDEAFGLLDVEVRAGRRAYANVLAEHVITVASRLQARHMASVATAPPPAPAPMPAQALLPAPAGEKRLREPPPPYAVLPTPTGPPLVPLSAAPTKQRRTEQGGEFWDPACKFFEGLCAGALSGGGGIGRSRTVHVGRSTAMERNYSRGEPTMDDIRPLPVLRQALQYVLREAASGGAEYLSDQLKGMRQDLRVQDIRNPFAVGVYEMHARVCLELGNLSEFNQCQSALRTFYREGLAAEDGDHFGEFLAYRLAYLALGDQNDLLALELKECERLAAFGTEGGGGGQGDGGRLRARIDEAFSSEAFLLAVRFCVCIQQGDSLRALKIAQRFDLGMKRLLAIFLPRQRVKWLNESVSSIKGKLPTDFIAAALGFAPGLMVADKNALLRLPKRSADRAADVATLQGTPVAHLLYVDQSLPRADAAWADLWRDLKLPAPPASVGDVAARAVGRRIAALQAGDAPTAASSVGDGGPKVDAAEIGKAVAEYCSFLVSRTDIAPE